MPEQTSSIISKVWGLCNPLRDDGVSYGDYLEQLTYLIFLKMSDEYSKPPYEKDTGIPAGYTWQDMNALKGAELEEQYKATLEMLGEQVLLDVEVVFHSTLVALVLDRINFHLETARTIVIGNQFGKRGLHLQVRFHRLRDGYAGIAREHGIERGFQEILLDGSVLGIERQGNFIAIARTQEKERRRRSAKFDKIHTLNVVNSWQLAAHRT